MLEQHQDIMLDNDDEHNVPIGHSRNLSRTPSQKIHVYCENKQPSAYLSSTNDNEFDEVRSNKSTSTHDSTEDEKNDKSTNAADYANQIIGGSNMIITPLAHQGTDESNLSTCSADAEQVYEFSKPRFIQVKDINHLDTEEQKNSKKYNKDNKIFSLSLPFGENNKLPNRHISMFNLFTPVKENAAAEESSYDSNESSNEESPEVLDLMKSRTYSLLKEETPQTKQKIKEKLKRTNSISSLEELELYRDEKGIENVRNKAIKESLGIEGFRHQLKQITMDENAKTKDGYTYKRINSIWDDISGDFIIMGGYRGSILRDAYTNKRLWVPMKAGLNLTKIDLYIGPNEEDEIRTQKDIVPDGMLTHVGPVDISRKLINRLGANPNVEIETFGYDWRLSLGIPTKQLGDRLKEIYEKQKTDPRYNGKPKGTYILAHSMGGVIAHKALQDYTKYVRGIIYIGSPSQCPNILGPIRFGDSVLWNKSILSSEANFFMRSTLYFLPADGRCFINRDTYERYDFDYFDSEVWKALGLSPLVSDKRLAKIKKDEKKHHYHLTHKHIFEPKRTSSMTSLFALDVPNPLTVLETVNSKTKEFVKKVPILGKEIVNNITDTLEEVDVDYNFRTSYEDSCSYLDRTLKEADDYLKSLEYDESKDYPPLVTVYGNRVPTVRGCKVEGIQGIIDGDYDDLYYGSGDGVVHHSWLLPERKGFTVVAKIVSETGHVSLMTDFESMSKALISLYDADKEKEKVEQTK